MNFDGVCVGIISKPVGVKGTVKIHPYTSSPSFFLERNSFYLSDKKEVFLYNQRIKNKTEIVADIKGYDSRDSVELLRLKKLFILKDQLPKLQNDEYYLNDFADLKVLSKSKECIGKVLAALDYGAGAFLDIKTHNYKGTSTLPFNKDCILEINLNDGYIVINEDFLIR